MLVNLLSAADIARISVVDKGANAKRYFLRKQEGGDEVTTQVHRLLKAEDWSAVYCVVAEPGWQENPGMGAPDPLIPDEWADEDEIRKAAHQFLKNGGLINKMHESLEPYGELVENAVALADLTIEGVDGPETIKKGSWYIAFEPSAEGKLAIEKGEFSGVSIEGTAMRTLIDKANVDNSTSAMVALFPTPELATELALTRRDGATESPADLHLTLAFLGKAGDAAEQAAVVTALRAWAQACPPLTGEVSGHGRFIGGPTPVTYLSVDLPALPAQRQALVSALEGAGLPPSTDHGFTPHITLAFNARHPKLEKPVPVTFDRVTLAWGDEHVSVPLGGIAKADPGEYVPVGMEAVWPDEEARMHASLDAHLLTSNGEEADMFEPLAKAGLLNFSPKQNWVDRAGGLPPLIDRAAAHIFGHGKPVSTAVAYAVNWAKKGCATGRAFGGKVKVSAAAQGKMCAAVADWEKKRASTHVGKAKVPLGSEAIETPEHVGALIKAWSAPEADRDSLGFMDRLGRRIAKKLGISDDEITELTKADTTRTFGDLIGQREFEDDLPDAFRALEDSVWDAFYPRLDETRTTSELISTSLDEFKAWATSKLEDGDAATVAKVRQAVADTQVIADAESDLAKAAAKVTDHAAKVKEAFAAAHTKYPDGVPKAVSTSIFKDPAAWLAANSDSKVKKVELSGGAFDPAQLSEEEYAASCLLDRGEDVTDVAKRYGLPVREASGAVNVAALDAAAAALSKGSDELADVAPMALAKAKLALAQITNAAGYDLPDELAKFGPIAPNADSDNFDSMLTAEEKGRLEKVESTLESLPDTISDTVIKAVKEAVPAEVAKAAPKEDEPDKAALEEKLTKLEGELDETKANLAKLADGDTSQDKGGNGDGDADGVAKAERQLTALEKRELSPALAGVAS